MIATAQNIEDFRRFALDAIGDGPLPIEELFSKWYSSKERALTQDAIGEAIEGVNGIPAEEANVRLVREFGFDSTCPTR